MKKSLSIIGGVLLLLAGLTASTSYAARRAAQDNETPKQDMKDAGHSTKRAVKKTGRATKKETKKVVHKSAKKTREGAQKVENKTDPDNSR